MKKNVLILSQFILISICFGQNYNPIVEGLMNQTNLDSLVSYVRFLSGEDSVLIGDSTVLITHRVSYQGNDLAAEYIKQKLSGYGLEIYDQRYSPTGRNIFAIQRGIQFPQKYFIYCAHYDAVTDFCADDNASGTAGVLEAARILSNQQVNYSIIYALWDEEENGKVGSRFYAAQADSNDMDIIGVLNFEMSGWDSDNDGKMDIHTRPIANSIVFADFLLTIDSLYSLPIQAVVFNPGTSASDHSAFWQYNYSAICFSEAYYGGDFNPYYHSNLDRIDKFNLDYFHNVAKLGVASITTLALENIITEVHDEFIVPGSFYISNYPNPFNNLTIVRFDIPYDNYLSIDIFNIIGERVKNLYSGYKKAGSHEMHFDASNITSGMYLIVLRSSGNIINHKIVVLK